MFEKNVGNTKQNRKKLLFLLPTGLCLVPLGGGLLVFFCYFFQQIANLLTNLLAVDEALGFLFGGKMSPFGLGGLKDALLKGILFEHLDPPLFSEFGGNRPVPPSLLFLNLDLCHDDFRLLGRCRRPFPLPNNNLLVLWKKSASTHTYLFT